MLSFTNLKSKSVKITATAIVVIIIFLVFNPLVIINSGSRGLRFTFGAVDEKVLGEGIHLRIPLVQKVKSLTVRPMQLDHAVIVGPEGAISKDNQNIGSTLVVFYKYMPDKLAYMWRSIGTEKMESIILKIMTENFKKQIGKYTIFEVAPVQEKIRAEVIQNMKLDLAPYPIEVTELRITNYDWPESFEKQIEETMSRAQQVKQKEQELLIAEQEAQKSVKQAEALKTATITTAEGTKEAARLNADAKVLEGEGIRKYNESIRQNMQQEIEFRKLAIEMIRAERWDGRYVPNNNYGPIPVSTGKIQPEN